MKKLKNFIFNRDINYLIVSAIIIICALYPFWFFGKFSSLGWYDEIDAQIPWNYLNNTSSGFYPNWAGGIGREFGYGIERISFYRILIDFFPLWGANSIIKFFSLFSLFFGLYFFIKKFFPVSEFTAFSMSLYGVFASYFPYGWTLGGMGFDLSVAVWLAIVYFVSFDKIQINYILGFIIVIISPTVSSFVFSFVLSFFFLSTILLIFYKKIKIDKNRIYLWIFIGLLYVFFMILNWYSIFYHINDAKEFSTRLIGTFDTKEIYDNNLFNIIKEEFEHLQAYFNKFSLPILKISFLIILFLVIIKNSYKEIFISFIMIILVPIIFIGIGKVYNFGVFSTYRWAIIWSLVSIFVPILISYLLSSKEVVFIKKQVINEKFLYILNIMIGLIFLVKSFEGIRILSDITLKNLENRSGGAITFYYDELNKLQDKENYRVITDYKNLWWSLPLFYNFSTFDGVNASMPIRRTYFLAYGLSKKVQDNYHHTKHFFYFDSKEELYNMKFFEMANVKYIISINKELAYNLKKVIEIKGFDYNEEKIKLNLAKQIYVYQLNNPWSKIFVAKNIFYSSFSYKDKSFYYDLMNLSFEDVLIASDDINENKININEHKNMLKIIDIKVDDHNIIVETNNEQGFLVVNQVFTPQWKAYCDEKQQDIIPVNGIMMGVNIKDNCKVIKFVYH